MTAKIKSRAAAPSASKAPVDDRWSTAILTTEGRLPRIGALGKLIDAHVNFICSPPLVARHIRRGRRVRREGELARVRESLQLA